MDYVILEKLLGFPESQLLGFSESQSSQRIIMSTQCPNRWYTFNIWQLIIINDSYVKTKENS